MGALASPPKQTGHKHTTMMLDQPWGDVPEQVRIFPPCEVERSFNRGDAVIIFTKGSKTKTWQRKRIGRSEFFPTSGFVAWDDRNEEYAWHEVGSIDVPTAKDPQLSESKDDTDDGARIPLDQQGLSGQMVGPGWLPFIRGESETVGGKPRRKRRTFTEWWSSRSRANDVPEFLTRTRKDAT